MWFSAFTLRCFDVYRNASGCFVLQEKDVSATFAAKNKDIPRTNKVQTDVVIAISGVYMATKVNIDALIPREDFEINETHKTGTPKATLSVEDLKMDSFFFSTLRKPDFQRETNDWDAKKIVEFLVSFVDGDLIPAIILWRSPSNLLFVIDGAHRISALAAWIHDDFGDGVISKQFYEDIIPDEQIAQAERTRRLVKKNVGSFSDFQLATTNPKKVKEAIQVRAKNLGALAIQLQWVEGDARKAEHSFFKINQQAAPINDTELVLLKSRKKPNCIAARAIFRSGTGHKYWSEFSTDKQHEIEELAHEINELLFSPKLDLPIKTLDVPVGGRLYSSPTLQIILQFVNLVNSVKPSFEIDLEDDLTGDATIKFLQRARQVANRINSVHPSSLGLHPTVYFYSPEGKHRASSFFATVVFILHLENRREWKEFTDVRKLFEELIIDNEFLIQQITRKHRTVGAGYEQIKDFFVFAMNGLIKGLNSETVIEQVLKVPGFAYLNTLQDASILTSPSFSISRKSAVFIREAIKSAPRCQICEGYIHRNSITIDHKTRRSEGGLGTVDNGQIAHPYCNTTYKH